MAFNFQDTGFRNSGMSEEEQIALAIQLSTEGNSGGTSFRQQNASNSSATSKNSRHRVLPFDASTYATKLKEGFEALFKEPTGSDVVIELKHKSGIEKIHCHSLVLSVWSQTFRMLLQTAVPEEINQEELLAASPSASVDESELELKKKNKNDDMDVGDKSIRKEYKKIIRLEVEEQNISCFKQMIEYLYKGTITLDQDKLIPMLAIATEYNLQPLRDGCGSVLGENINQENIFLLLEVVNNYQLTGLRLKVSDYLASNFQQLLSSGALLQLDLETWKVLAQSDDLNVDMEEQVFYAVMSYAEQFSGKQSEEILQTLLPFIRYPLMDPKSIVEIEEKPSLKNISVLQQLLFEAYRYKAHPNGKTSLRTEPRRGMRALLDLQNEYDGKKNRRGFGRWQ